MSKNDHPIRDPYGFGLRKDELPYAHKIPHGGNWRNLPIDEQKAFMKGSLGNGGGNSYQLRRMRWDEAAATILSFPMAKATCQLHPGGDEMIIGNHDRYPKRQAVAGEKNSTQPTTANLPRHFAWAAVTTSITTLVVLARLFIYR